MDSPEPPLPEPLPEGQEEGPSSFVIWLFTMMGMAAGYWSSHDQEQMVLRAGIVGLLGSLWLAWRLDRKHEVLSMVVLTFMYAVMVAMSFLAIVFGECLLRLPSLTDSMGERRGAVASLYRPSQCVIHSGGCGSSPVPKKKAQRW